MTEIVKFSASEILLAAQVGCNRQVMNLRDRRQDRYGMDKLSAPFEKHILGCLGEMAVAKHFNRFWSGAVGNFAAADVGSFIQVRATAYPDGRLTLHKFTPENESRPGDKPNDIFILARVLLPEVCLVGWMLGADGQQEKYWKAMPAQPKRPAFFIEGDDLRSMKDLIVP